MVLSAVGNFIPKIEGFAPLPSATADAFMAMQGGHMALYFGALYQFSKRLIASRTNDQFNAMAINPKLLTDMLDPHYKEITRAFEDHVNTQIDKTQEIVMTKAYDLEVLKIHQNVKLILSLPQSYWDALFQANKKAEDTLGTGGSQDSGSTGGDNSPGGDSAHTGTSSSKKALRRLNAAQKTTDTRFQSYLQIKDSNRHGAHAKASRKNTWLKELRRRDKILKKFGDDHYTPQYKSTGKLIPSLIFS